MDPKAPLRDKSNVALEMLNGSLKYVHENGAQDKVLHYNAHIRVRPVYTACVTQVMNSKNTEKSDRAGHPECIQLLSEAAGYPKETFFCWRNNFETKQDDKFSWSNNASTVLCRPNNLCGTNRQRGRYPGRRWLNSAWRKVENITTALIEETASGRNDTLWI